MKNKKEKKNKKKKKKKKLRYTGTALLVSTSMLPNAYFPNAQCTH